MGTNQKDLRILKLHRKGYPPAMIAAKIGYGGNIAAGEDRVRDALERAGIDIHGKAKKEG